MSHSPPKVLVIMRSKNCDRVIGQALASLFRKNTDASTLWSWIPVRGIACARHSPTVACRLRCLPAEEYFPGLVLNQAITEAEGELVVFQNSDAVMLTPHTLGSLLAPSQAAVQATFGRQAPRPDAAS
jgi:hypothetical protein